MARVIVVGAGVVGLTSAVRLLEAGHDVHVHARDLPLETTSVVAAALWYPYLAAPQDRVSAWAATAYATFAELAGAAESGVRMLPGTELLRTKQPDPWWAHAVPDLKRRTDLPPSYADGWDFVSPVVEMPIFLSWLAARVEALGGTITRLQLSALPDATSPGSPVIVNATGLAARHFADDLSVRPVRGQVVVVEQFGLDRWLLDGDGLTYVVPRSTEVIVGGTEVDGEWSRTPDPRVAEGILARAGRLIPEIREARTLRHRVGLRPARETVRLERVGNIVHNYGHGGAGVTLSWGCADEVVELVGP